MTSPAAPGDVCADCGRTWQGGDGEFAPVYHECVEWLECGECGGTAVRAELDGAWPNANACGECLCPGWVEMQPDGSAAWVTDVAEAPTLRSGAGTSAADPAVDS